MPISQNLAATECGNLLLPWSVRFVIDWTVVSVFSENEPFFHTLWAIQFPSLWIVCSCSLAAKLSSKILFLSWESQSSVQLYSTSLSVFRWLVAFKRVSDSKNVISIWFLTEKSYMFHRMLPRLFSKTITKVIIIVSLNILKYTVAYSCSSYVQPLGNTFLLLASLGLIRTIWSFLFRYWEEWEEKKKQVWSSVGLSTWVFNLIWSPEMLLQMCSWMPEHFPTVPVAGWDEVISSPATP